MTSIRSAALPSTLEQGSLWRDLLVIVLVVMVAAILFTQVELNEWLFVSTRKWEALQLDELPAVLVVLATCLSWFAWRRYREGRIEIGKRQAAEARLATLLLRTGASLNSIWKLRRPSARRSHASCTMSSGNT